MSLVQVTKQDFARVFPVVRMPDLGIAECLLTFFVRVVLQVGLKDAEKLLKLRPNWPKAYLRKGTALLLASEALLPLAFCLPFTLNLFPHALHYNFPVALLSDSLPNMEYDVLLADLTRCLLDAAGAVRAG